MQLFSLVLTFAVAAALSAAPARAQPAKPSAPEPYKAVAVTLPADSDDASLAAFRQELAAVAKGRVYSSLARLVASSGFFWDRDFGGTYDRRKPAVDNLATALRLEHNNGAGWSTLGAIAAERSAARLPGRPGVVCAPGKPDFDAFEFDRLLDATRTDGTDWTYPRADRAPVRGEPQQRSAVVATLGLHFVRMLGHTGKDNEPDALGTVWVQVATPAGKTGFVAPGTLTSLYVERLCYGKDPLGRWGIAGYVGAGD